MTTRRRGGRTHLDELSEELLALSESIHLGGVDEGVVAKDIDDGLQGCTVIMSKSAVRVRYITFHRVNVG